MVSKKNMTMRIFFVFFLIIPCFVFTYQFSQAGFDKSIDFERGSYQSAKITSASSSISFADDFTIESWIKLESLPSANGQNYSILTQWDNGSRGFVFTYTYYNVSGGFRAIRMEMQNSANTASIEKIVPYDFALDTWYHVAVSYDKSGGDAVVYINGYEVGVMTGLPAGMNNSSADIVVGHDANYGSQSSFDGLIDGVRVWSSIRSETEIRANMFTEIVADVNLQASWQFEGDYQDSTSHGNDLLPVNSPVFSTEPAQMSFSL